ncbi:CD1247 N-terminal domain-containing protein [Laceyella sacchari]|jgi:hypothetical protein|uniref:Zinc-ribbon domain-containing protein n=1 Tax=Laceyella sacchari TaxID=37482 RepID=A0ABY5U548_LACSH|nr:CD1247 N-terminal domain-containing protein [Laceyella sacchari]TCW41189.1 hypothetical protein EDC32_101850 [Laceyella sacchari]UWE04769.1 zinc-ribbon domain-containing protein [Laceyella sacchari]
MFESIKRDLSFIQGLLEGDVNHQHHVEYRGLSRLVDVVDLLVESVEQLERRLSELEEYVETIDEDLNELELLCYDDDEEDDEWDHEIEVTCPECGEDVTIDEDDLEDENVELLCPKCHTVLDLEEIDEEDVETVISED